MANKNIFKGKITPKTQKANTKNEAGGKAYSMDAEAALAQLAVTGCFNDTYYVSAEEQLKTVLKLSKEVHPEFLAKLALYAREQGYMKDMPAMLCAILSEIDVELLKTIFSRVINNGKMVRNFVQIIRSGVVGRKSLGSAPRNLIRDWFNESTAEYIFKNSVGQTPSMADVIKLTHPKPDSKEKEALFGYLLGKEVKKTNLPKIVKEYEAFKAKKSDSCPDVPMNMLTSLELSTENWIEIARNATWQTARMNLNTFARHGVFNDSQATKHIIKLLQNPDEVRNAKVFPYQLMVAYMNCDSSVPMAVKDALQDAMEVATENVPSFGENTHVCIDISGSMSGNPVTGHREGATTVATCIQVAALIGVSIARNNKGSDITAFEGRVRPHNLNYRDSVMSNAQKLASMGGGSTDCACALAKLNDEKAEGDVVIYVSDNESWFNGSWVRDSIRGSTGMSAQWNIYKKRNPKAKLVCIDLCANTTVQVTDSGSTLNIGGWSNTIFDIIKRFTDGKMKSDWTSVINKMEL